MRQGGAGRAADGSYAVGARRTFPVALTVAWSRLFSPEGLSLWLGRIVEGSVESDSSYRTEEGIEGRVRVRKPLSHVRMLWKPHGWDRASTLQLRLIPAKSGTTVSFHQEGLVDADARARMRERWMATLEALAPFLSGGA